MSERLVLVMKPLLNVWINEYNRPVRFAKAEVKHSDAIEVIRMRITFEMPRIEDDYLHIDAKGLIELMSWIDNSRPNMKQRALYDQLGKYFPGDIHFDAMLRGALRASLEGLTQASGEEAHFEKRASAQIETSKYEQQ